MFFVVTINLQATPAKNLFTKDSISEEPETLMTYLFSFSVQPDIQHNWLLINIANKNYNTMTKNREQNPH